MRARSTLLIAALLTTCTPGPAPKKEPRVHPEFPITQGATHALGKMTALDGEVKCQSCHLLTQTNFAQFECTGCHRHDEATALADHSKAGLVDGYAWSSRACYGCHGNGTASRIRHDPARDVYVTSLEPTWQGNVITGVTAVDAGLPMEMNHLATTLACATCHPNAELGSFYPGQFHGTLDAIDAGQPATGCAVCHVRGAPSGFVGALQLTRDPPTGRMRHDLDAGLGADCSACHTPPSQLSDAGWTATAAFHASVQPAKCLECHANTRPGVLDSTNAALPQGRRFNHQGDIWLGECSDCHTGFQSWAGGRFHHLPEFRTRSSCLPCHDGERPADSGIVKDPPFDYDTNARGVKHGAGQDCVLCHGASTQRFDGGFFGHDAGVVVTQTCVACHTTQRPGVAVNGFLHSVAGTGDCFGCHQASTATPRTAFPGDWAGGQRYPAGNLISSSDRLITVTQTQLLRNDAGLVTATAVTQATLYNAMLHTSQFALDAGPAPGDPNTCSLCHIGSPAGSLNITTQGVFHTSVPSQPTACVDCHSNMRPTGIVQKTNLRPMDHSLAAGDCALCHSSPGIAWNDGRFHPDAGASDCTSCHYTLMADAAAVDVISTASPGPKYQMKHKSAQLKDQRCDRCHVMALATAPGAAVATQWRPGELHSRVAAQPTACADCHRPVSLPAGATTSSGGFGMNHGAAFVAAKDCAFCHAADATAATWSKATKLHIAGVTPPGCSLCHANNAPAGLHDTDVITSASAATGVSGQKVKIAHADVNVSTRDCGFCHLQAGTSFSGAKFHARFTGAATLTGRCSNCHFNLRPTAAFAAHDHSGYEETTGTDCSACHTWPGPNGAASPSWHSSSGGGAGSAPQSITVGGFTVASPPAANTSTTQAGLNGLAHPAIPAGGSCTTCHSMASGGRGAFAYDHALAPATGCAACHEAGSNLVASPWVLNAPGAAMVTAQCTFGGGQILDRGGDTRPVGIASIACLPSSKNTSNHFFPADCGECHRKPAGVPAVNTTGAAFAGAWRFVHSFGAPVQSSTCSKCH